MDLLSLIDFQVLKEILIEALIENTYSLLALTAVVAAVGVPLPQSLLVISAGAFAAQGLVDFPVIVLITSLFSTMGDNIGYFVGREMSMFKKYLPSFTRKLAAIEGRQLGKRTSLTIFLTRFLFTALGPPVNVLSGLNRIPHKKFLLYGSMGELIWALEMTGLGYFFGIYVEEVFDLVSNVIIFMAILLALVWLAKKSA